MPEASMGWVSQQREKLKLAGKSNVERKLRSLCRKYMDFILLVGDGDGHRGEGGKKRRLTRWKKKRTSRTWRRGESELDRVDESRDTGRPKQEAPVSNSSLATIQLGDKCGDVWVGSGKTRLASPKRMAKGNRSKLQSPPPWKVRPLQLCRLGMVDRTGRE
jgi:hypothetical protein